MAASTKQANTLDDNMHTVDTEFIYAHVTKIMALSRKYCYKDFILI